MVKDKITLNVLADITRRIGSNQVSETKNTKDHALVVFNGSNISLDDKLREIKQLKEEGVAISLAFSFMGNQIIEKDRIINYLKPDRVYGEEDILKLKDIGKRYSYVIAPTLTINTMSKVTRGFIDSFVSNIIWTFLYMGKNVYIDFTSTLNYLDVPCENPAIEKIILDHISSIRSLGAIEVETGNYSEVILSKSLNNRYKNSNKTKDLDDSYIKRESRSTGFKVQANSIDFPSINIKKSSDKKVFTQQDIIEMSKSSNSIVVPKRSIITPLGKDKIRELGISVKFE